MSAANSAKESMGKVLFVMYPGDNVLEDCIRAILR